MRNRYPLKILIAVVLLVALWAPASSEDIKLSGKIIETSRHRITLSDSGLPEQIEILAAQSELPLELRGGKEEISVQVLQSIGRGKQLRGPIRIEVAAGGNAVAAEVVEVANPTLKGAEIVSKAKLRAGEVNIGLDLSYGPHGDLAGQIEYSGKGDVESIGLTIDLLGTVDLAFAGTPISEKLQAYSFSDYGVSNEEGLVWGNSDKDAKAQGRKPSPGPVTQMFVGGGDRGFTWLSNNGKGWDADAKASTATLTRDKVAQVTWKILFVNHKTRLNRKQSVEFALRVHPSRNRDANHRALAWLDWPFNGKSSEAPPATLSKQKKVDLLRADSATAHESQSLYAILEGTAGGDALASAGTHTETWPMNLFRYLAGTHTSLVTRLHSNASTLTRPSADPAADRVLLGRALLCDIGLDAESLANLTGAAKVLSALDNFGYFESDGKTEFIPFWRGHSVIRFGDSFNEDDAFALTDQNPVGQVYVSVYRRPQTGRGTQTMIVIANESNQPVRDQLYVLDPNHIFGGANVLDHAAIKGTYDFSRFHKMSDWMKAGVVGKSGKIKGLQDMEDQGVIRQNAAKDGIEVYGPNVFIPAHDFRILFGKSK
ncbi:MAG: hypothetical protein O3B01_07520 [Planctomycetota bacterium]|nr:hypothetical protein [Planctomycetota bacterium]MDA1138419.1 hypothetical protein [Planctomycetota bacterium]